MDASAISAVALTISAASTTPRGRHIKSLKLNSREHPTFNSKPRDKNITANSKKTNMRVIWSYPQET
jgi:hypothetical protein